jgi:hypothetical protein
LFDTGTNRVISTACLVSPFDQELSDAMSEMPMSFQDASIPALSDRQVNRGYEANLGAY